MLLRRFNQAGLEAFRTFVATLKNDKTLPAPISLLTDAAFSEPVLPATECPDTVFDNRLAAAKYLDRVFSAAGLGDAFEDVALWSWLSLRFFDQLRPLGAGISIKKLGVDEARFIPSSNFTDRHRHLLRHPLQIYRLVNRDEKAALCFLVQRVHEPGDIVEQFGSRQLYTRNKEILATLTQLVVDESTAKIRPKASGRARRIDIVLQHFDCTWDLGFISRERLVDMLPAEFKEYRRTRRQVTT